MILLRQDSLARFPLIADSPGSAELTSQADQKEVRLSMMYRALVGEAPFPLELCRFLIKPRALSSHAFKIKMSLNQLIKMSLCCSRSPFFLGRLERSDLSDLGRWYIERGLMPPGCAPPCLRELVRQRSKDKARGRLYYGLSKGAYK